MKTLTQVRTELATGAMRTSLFKWGVPVLRGTKTEAGSLVVVGGRTGVGKSFFGLKCLVDTHVPGLYVSLEDSYGEVDKRTSGLSPDVAQRLYVHVPARPSIGQIARAIESAFGEGKPNPLLVFVDYVQLFKVDVGNGTRTDAIGDAITELKGLGRELGFVTVLSSQMKRPGGGDSSPSKPSRWEFRDSSNIENSAETIVLLHAEREYESGCVYKFVEAWVEKNKSGPEGRSQLYAVDAHTGWQTPVVSKSAAFANPEQFGVPVDGDPSESDDMDLPYDLPSDTPWYAESPHTDNW